MRVRCRGLRLEFEEGLPRLQAEELARQWITLRRGHVAGLCTAIMPAGCAGWATIINRGIRLRGGRAGQITVEFRGRQPRRSQSEILHSPGFLILMAFPQ